jgi:hypothetical protein
LAVLEFLQDLRHVVDAPPEALLACPIGLIAALHFASGEQKIVQGARVDRVVRAAREETLSRRRPAWVKTLGVCLGLSVAVGNFLYIQDPALISSLLSRIPY